MNIKMMFAVISVCLSFVFNLHFVRYVDCLRLEKAGCNTIRNAAVFQKASPQIDSDEIQHVIEPRVNASIENEIRFLLQELDLLADGTSIGPSNKIVRINIGQDGVIVTLIRL